MQSAPCSSNEDNFSRELKKSLSGFEYRDEEVKQENIKAFSDSSNSSICHINSPNFDTADLDNGKLPIEEKKTFIKELNSDLNSSCDVELNLLRPLSK